MGQGEVLEVKEAPCEIRGALFGVQMTAEQIQLFLNAAGSPAAIALASSPVALKVLDCIRDYVGVLQKPQQILNEGEAQAYADAKGQLIKQSLSLDATEEQRLLARGLLAETNKTMREQKNRESIVAKALPEVKEDAKPEEVEDDWYANFFDKSRLVSDEEMQMLWGKVLAGEVNEPGTFSRRTLSLLSSLDKKDANNFLLLCRFSGTNNRVPDLPMIYNHDDQIFKNANLNFTILQNLDSIGLVSHNMLGFLLKSMGKDNELRVDYFSTIFILEFPGIENAKFQRGVVMFTDLGQQLARLCSPQPYNGFEEYLVSKWKELGYKVTIHRPNEAPQEA